MGRESFLASCLLHRKGLTQTKRLPKMGSGMSIDLVV